MDFAGKVIIVTGAGSGLGQCLGISIISGCTHTSDNKGSGKSRMRLSEYGGYGKPLRGNRPGT